MLEAAIKMSLQESVKPSTPSTTKQSSDNQKTTTKQQETNIKKN